VHCWHDVHCIRICIVRLRFYKDTLMSLIRAPKKMNRFAQPSLKKTHRFTKPLTFTNRKSFCPSTFLSGDMTHAYRYFGAHKNVFNPHTLFRVFAPHAKNVSVVGDFNKWDTAAHPMQRTEGGIWQLTVTCTLDHLSNYKYTIFTHDGRCLHKSDPFAFHAENGGQKNSKLYNPFAFKWTDHHFLQNRCVPYDKPVNIYEAHIGSWRTFSDGKYFNYRKFADEICVYLQELSYTHLELMGVAEYPFDASWGYQVTNFFAPTSRYGLPEDFAYLVNKLHAYGIALIVDWVPGHFPKDANGLYQFDGQPLYEPEDALRQEHKEWGTCCFNYGHGAVKSFLISNALYWLDVFHVDGLRVDAVASMLYHDYGRQEYRPNCMGGKENLEAIQFFQALNTAVFKQFPYALMIAEESTAWPLVTKPVEMGGLGFNFKWNMGWMNDSLTYTQTDPYFRSHHHDKLTFSLNYAFSENYILPISHDEVVHGKGSLVNKMPLGYKEKLAGWRSFLMYQFAHPGKKLTMMGTEFAQFSEWNFCKELDWLLLEYPAHKDALAFSKALNGLYKATPALYQIEDSWQGFSWRMVDNSRQNLLAFERIDKVGNRVLCVFNFSNTAYKGSYRHRKAWGIYVPIK